MSVNDEMIQPSSDSFWEVDCYKRTVKRHEDGYKLCTDLMQLIQDRAEIEKHYAKSLRGWSKKWNELIEKGNYLHNLVHVLLHNISKFVYDLHKVGTKFARHFVVQPLAIDTARYFNVKT